MYDFFSWILLFLLAAVAGCQSDANKNGQENYVVVLSMDGFRWDYPEKVHTPNLDRLAREGTRAEALQPAFPSKTFPNHYTMATGLYPDHHGIVQNNFYDEEMKEAYSIRDREAVMNGAFYGGEPIWVTAERQGLRAASYFWVGSEADVQGLQPSTWKPYKHDFPFGQRIDSVVAWLQRPEKERPRLIMWYMHEPDAIGHRVGPDAPQTRQTIERLDSLLGVFLAKVEALPIAGQIDLIVTSDHGMGAISPGRSVQLADHLPGDWVARYHGGNPVYILEAAEGKQDTLLRILENVPHISAWETGKLPERLHYGTHPRTMDIVAVADSSYSLYWDNDKPYSGGAHGYDNQNPDMHAIFYARGPHFKKAHKHPRFKNVDLYNLIVYLLDLEPAPNDGDFSRIDAMLR